MTIINTYKNGNSSITIHQDGTRVVECDGKLDLEYPLNIDIRLSNKCAFGMNPKTSKAICEFCHESASTDGTCVSYTQIDELLEKLNGLPAGTELAVGINSFAMREYDKFAYFLERASERGWICNITVNQGMLNKSAVGLITDELIAENLIKGLGISYRKGYETIPKQLLEYKNTVVHVIAGIDTIQEVKELAVSGVKKILILGEKDFGFNSGKVDTSTKTHVQWRQGLHELFKLFDVVSFDNLAVEQLLVKRFFNDETWNEFYQGEHSFYINAVDQYFARSSRSNFIVSYDQTDVKSFFRKYVHE